MFTWVFFKIRRPCCEVVVFVFVRRAHTHDTTTHPTYRQAKSYSSQAPRKSRPKFHKHPLPSKDLPSRVQRLTDRFRLVAGRSFHHLSRRWQRSLQILCVHVQLLLRASRNGGGLVAAAAACSFAGKWGRIFTHLLDSASLGSRRRTSKVCFFAPLFAFFCFFPLFYTRWQRRATVVVHCCRGRAEGGEFAVAILSLSMFFTCRGRRSRVISSPCGISPPTEPLCPHLQGP